MALSRKQQLEFCNQCTKKHHDRKKGVVCNLTYERATFQSSCPDYEEDPVAAERIKNQKKHNAAKGITGKGEKPSGVFGSEKQMMNGGAGGGILMIIGGLAWFVIGYMAGYIFFYPFFLVIGGLIVVGKAGAKKAQDIQRHDSSAIIDDKDDLEIL